MISCQRILYQIFRWYAGDVPKTLLPTSLGEADRSGTTQGREGRRSPENAERSVTADASSDGAKLKFGAGVWNLGTSWALSRVKLTTVKFYASTDRCVCCDVPYDGFARYPFCDQCFSGRCRRCARRLRESILSPFHLIGHQRGLQMACGWGCGACLTERQMRTHFTIGPKRPAISDHERRGSPHRAADSGQTNKRLRRSKAKRGRPPGRRMPAAGSAEPSLRPARFAGISPSAGGDHSFELGHTNACRTLQSSWSCHSPGGLGGQKHGRF